MVFPTSDDVQVFTWIGHDVDETFADWAKDLGFTDVIVRHGIDDQISYDNLAQREITFWRWIAGGFGASNWTIQDYVSALTLEISQSPSGNVYVDDCDAIYNFHGPQAFTNFLEAVRQVQNKNVILCFYASSQTTHYHGLCAFADSVDLSDFDVDIYHPPAYDLTPELLSAINPRTLGQYIWCWSGSGEYVNIGHSWETINETLIQKKYSEASVNDLARLVVWSGHEYDPVMYEASLYHYPNWWDFIRTLNSLTIPEYFFPLLLGLLVITITAFVLCSRLLRKREIKK